MKCNEKNILLANCFVTVAVTKKHAQYRAPRRKGIPSPIGIPSETVIPGKGTPGMIEAQIKGLKDNKSPGADGIYPRLLKEIVDDISVPLAIAFNLSIQEGIVPREWKNANIIPILKKGSRCTSTNYRPVSLTSVICKLLESLLRDHTSAVLRLECSLDCLSAPTL